MAEDDQPLESLWRQGTPAGAAPPTPEEAHARAVGFERTIGRRNRREYIAGALVTLFFGWQAVSAERLGERAGHLLIVVGALLAVTQLARRGAARQAPDALAADGVSYLRGELERQADLLRSVWWWYLAPLVPGLVVLFADGGLKRGSWSWAAVRLAGALGLFGLVGLLNWAAARALDREAASLR